VQCFLKTVVVALSLCFSILVQSQGGVLGSRGVGEGAEAEEPFISKGGKCPVYYTVLYLLSQTTIKTSKGRVEFEASWLLNMILLSVVLHIREVCIQRFSITSQKEKNRLFYLKLAEDGIIFCDSLQSCFGYFQ